MFANIFVRTKILGRNRLSRELGGSIAQTGQLVNSRQPFHNRITEGLRVTRYQWIICSLLASQSLRSAVIGLMRDARRAGT